METGVTSQIEPIRWEQSLHLITYPQKLNHMVNTTHARQAGQVQHNGDNWPAVETLHINELDPLCDNAPALLPEASRANRVARTDAASSAGMSAHASAAKDCCLRAYMTPSGRCAPQRTRDHASLATAGSKHNARKRNQKCSCQSKAYLRHLSE